MIQFEDGQVHIAIDQHGCDRISIVRKSGYLGTLTSETHVLKLDGKEQKDSPCSAPKSRIGRPRNLLAPSYK